nr:hypothetical protein [Tanacetum cinerariifolium]
PEHADDEIVAEDQPYAEDASPAAQSPEYVLESDLEAHLEDDDDEDLKEDLVDHPADGGDDGDDEEGISIPAPVPMPAWSDSEVVRLLAMSSPPASPLSPWSSPPHQIPFPPLPSILSPPSPVLSPAPPPSPIPFTSPPPLQLPSASRREDIPEVTLPPQKKLGIALGLGYKVGESSSAAAARPAGGLRADYGFVATMDREIMRDPERERQDTDEIYMRLDDEQTERHLLAGRLNMLFRDRRTHAYTRHLMEIEARMSREAWVRSTDASDLVRGEVMSLRTIILGQMMEIRELHAADRRRQIVISELLMADHKRSTEIIESRTALQGQVTALQGQVTALQAQVIALQGQQGLAGGPTQPELPEEAEMLRADHRRFAEIRGLRTADRTRQQQLIQTLTVMQSLQRQVTPLQGQELALLCRRMFPEESDKIKRYIGGLPDMIHGSVVAFKPKTTQEAVEIATELMDKKIRTFAERETESKRKFKNTSRSTQNQQQQPNKRQHTGRVYTTASGEKKQYGGSKPLCAKCNYHHDGPCAPKCHKCNKVGHFARDCRSTANTNNANNQRGIGSGQKPTSYECGVQGHFKRECPKMKNNNNHGNQGGRDNAPAKVYAVGRTGTDPDSNVGTGTFLLNN